jgi:hypothetical protein
MENEKKISRLMYNIWHEAEPIVNHAIGSVILIMVAEALRYLSLRMFNPISDKHWISQVETIEQIIVLVSLAMFSLATTFTLTLRFFGRLRTIFGESKMNSEASKSPHDQNKQDV